MSPLPTDSMLVEPALLRRSGTTIGQTSETFGAGLQALQATLTTENPWGSDEPGSLFGMAYTAVLGHALDVLGSHVEQLCYAAEGLIAWADNVDQTEQQNVTMLSGIQTPTRV